MGGPLARERGRLGISPASLPGQSGWFHGQYTRPTLRCRSRYTLPCVCVSRTLWAEAGVSAGVVREPAYASLCQETAGPGGTLPGNTIAKALTAWSSWETVTASGLVLALQKNTTPRREGKREGRREGRGWILAPIQRWLRETRVLGTSECDGCLSVYTRACVDSACGTWALCQRMVTGVCGRMIDDIFPDTSKFF